MIEEKNSESVPCDRPVWQLVYFLLMWQTLYRVSNTALKVLLKFLSLFVLLFGRAFAPAAVNESLHRFAAEIPHSIQNGHKLLWNTTGDDFITFVVCPKCDSVYKYDDCVVTVGGKKESKRCENVAYPNHPSTCLQETKTWCSSDKKTDLEEATSFLLLKRIHIYHYTNPSLT